MNIEYTAAVGTKFNKDGSLRPFPGNSIVCQLDESSLQHVLISALLVEMAGASFSDAFALLPPESLHMTLFDLICDEIRVQANWSSLIPLDCSLEEADKILNGLQSQVEKPENLRMSFHHFELEKTIGTVLVPADDESSVALYTYREELSKVTGIRHPNHDTYFYHISMAYILRNLSETEKSDLDFWVKSVDERLEKSFGNLKLPAPELVLFPDMASFPKIRSGNYGM